MAFFRRLARPWCARRVSDVCICESAIDVGISARRHRNVQFGMGQMAHMVAVPSWEGARPVHLLSGWLWLRGWLSAHRNRSSRMADPETHTPLFLGLAPSRLGLGMAASGLSAAWTMVFEGRALSPRKGGARLYITRGVTREATKELGRWGPLAPMDSVYNKTRTGEVLPEKRAAVEKACAVLGATAFVEDLDRDACPDSDEALGSDKGVQGRAWRRRFCSSKGYLVPLVALPIPENFWSLLGRRIRRLNLSDPQR